jgi:PleD family two-component response regulator
LASSNHRLIGWREVIELADRRLYDAKNNGRNQFHVKDDSASLQVLKSG